MTKIGRVDEVSSDTGDGSEVGQNVGGPCCLIEDVLVEGGVLSRVDCVITGQTVGINSCTSFTSRFKPIIKVASGTDASVVDKDSLESNLTL